jgi:general stress protein 26
MDNSHKDNILTIMKNAKRGMLVTKGKDFLSARPMHVIQNEYDGTLWFFSNYNSKKNNEISGSEVCVTFQDQKTGAYMSLTGECTISRDMHLIEKFWSSEVEPWFPEGKSSPNVSMLKIDVEFGEYWLNDKTNIGTAI